MDTVIIMSNYKQNKVFKSGEAAYILTVGWKQMYCSEMCGTVRSLNLNYFKYYNILNL